MTRAEITSNAAAPTRASRRERRQYRRRFAARQVQGRGPGDIAFRVAVRDEQAENVG